MFMYNNQPNQTPPYPALIPSLPYPPPNQHNLQPVEPNTQSSRGQTSNSQTQVQEPQSLSISTGDNSASVEDGTDCGPPQPKRVCIDTPMAQLISYIKTIYERSAIEKQLNVVKWPPTPSKVFINLACIDRKTVVTKQEADEYTKAMVQDGNVDIILKKKTPIDFDDIVKDLPATALEKVILVEGAPGVGKSTFAWEFCRRWERGQIAQQYQLVLLLRLRDERMSTAKSLKDLIHHPRTNLCEVVAQELEESLGVNTLIILEGFDELPDACRRNDSLFSQLIYGNLLPFATILVTSRPWATSDLLTKWEHRIFQHIEILGFTESQIEEYVQSVFVGTETQEGGASDTRPGEYADEVMAYIRTYPQIKASMYIPLNSAIVVSVYQESKAGRCILPKTLTELYYGLTQTLLVRYLYGHPEYGQRKWKIHSLKQHSLPMDVYESLLGLSRIAYKGVCTEGSTSVQLIFSELPSNIQTLGLMQLVPQLYVTEGEGVSHNFLHLTVQEFLAALHISFMSPAEQLQHFQRHEDGRLRVVLRFLAGLTKLTALTHEQFKALLREIPDQQGDEQQRDCCKRMVPDISVSVHHINWLFEAQNTDLLHNHTVSFDFTREMQPLEYYSVGYCIVHSNCKWSLGIRGDMEEEKLQMLSSGAKSGDTKSTEHRVALRTEEPISSEDLNIIFTGLGTYLEEMYLRLADNGSSLSLCNLPALHILELRMCSKSTFNISSDFSLQSLESLTINARNSGNTLGLKSCEAIGKLLSTSISLKELHFNVAKGKIWSVGSKGMEAITKCISNNMALPLRSLEIECKCTFSNTAGKSLALFIRNSTSLKCVRMCNITVSAQGLQEVHEAIQHCSSLQEKKLKLLIHVECSEDATKYKQLFNDYPDKLDSIDWEATSHISKSDKRSDVMRLSAITIGLYYNRICSYLNLSHNNISDAGATDLAQALHHNSTLNRLGLSSINISDVGATDLAQALHHNSTLKELYLSHNNISDVGATDLAQALHHNSTLKVLLLHDNYGIGEEGTRQLVQALTVNTSIKGIWLPRRCEKYASQCMEYDAVKTRISFL